MKEIAWEFWGDLQRSFEVMCMARAQPYIIVTELCESYQDSESCAESGLQSCLGSAS